MMLLLAGWRLPWRFRFGGGAKDDFGGGEDSGLGDGRVFVLLRVFQVSRITSTHGLIRFFSLRA